MKNVRKTLAVCLSATLCGGLLMSTPLLAQTAPDAGQVLRESQTEPLREPGMDAPPLTVPEYRDDDTDDGPSLLVNAFTLSGNREFSDEELLPLLADLAGQELTLGQLHRAAGRISAYYRERGYLLTRAYLPQQTVEDGVVDIAVLEGRFDEIQVNNLSRVRDGVVARSLRPLKSGDTVRGKPVESALLRLDDIPGAEPRATLTPGSTPGTSNMVVDVMPTPLVRGSVDVDNYGNRYTGEYRVGGKLHLHSPLGLGDLLTLRGMISDESHTYFRGAYQLPLGPWGTQLGVAYSDMAYELGDDFADLGAVGEAQILSVYALQNLVRSRNFNLEVQLQYDDKQLTDEIEEFGSRSEKESELITATINGNLRDGTGVTAFALAFTSGKLTLLSELDQFFDALGPQAAGRFTIVRPSVLRLQHLGGNFSLHAQINGQIAGDNLDSSEKMSLGGAYGVRAYPQGEATGDQGWIANLELRYNVNQNWMIHGFVDHGSIRINRDPWTDDDNSRSLTGAGIGARWDNRSWMLDAALATPLGSEDAISDTRDRDPRLWARAAWRF